MPGIHPITHVEIICGPMFAGKTSEGITRGFTFAEINGGKCLVLSHLKDVRPEITGESGVSSHSKLVANLPIDGFHHEATDCLLSTLDTMLDCDFFTISKIVSIILDEAQFFNPVDVEKFVRLVHRLKLARHLYVCGLDGDLNQKAFNDWISRILPLSDNIRKLSAYCMHRGDAPDGGFCNADAKFTKRRLDAPDGDIGGSERWTAVCRSHL